MAGWLDKLIDEIKDDKGIEVPEDLKDQDKDQEKDEGKEDEPQEQKTLLTYGEAWLAAFPDAPGASDK